MLGHAVHEFHIAHTFPWCTSTAPPSCHQPRAPLPECSCRQARVDIYHCGPARRQRPCWWTRPLQAVQILRHGRGVRSGAAGRCPRRRTTIAQGRSNTHRLTWRQSVLCGLSPATADRAIPCQLWPRLWLSTWPPYRRHTSTDLEKIVGASCLSLCGIMALSCVTPIPRIRHLSTQSGWTDLGWQGAISRRMASFYTMDLKDLITTSAVDNPDRCRMVCKSPCVLVLLFELMSSNTVC